MSMYLVYSYSFQYVEAMEMCVEYNLHISEEMAERLTAPKGGEIDEATRLTMLLKMGECCMHQGSYLLAARKFTEGGDKARLTTDELDYKIENKTLTLGSVLVLSDSSHQGPSQVWRHESGNLLREKVQRTRNLSDSRALLANYRFKSQPESY